MLTFVRLLRVFAFLRRRGPCAFRALPAGAALLHLTQVDVDGPLGAPDVHRDGVLAETRKRQRQLEGPKGTFSSRTERPALGGGVSRHVSPEKAPSAGENHG